MTDGTADGPDDEGTGDDDATVGPDDEGTGDDASVAARDELAGVVDLFGVLTRPELSRALSEVAFKRRAEIDDAAIDAAIEAGLAAYHLVTVPAEAVDPSDGARDVSAGVHADDDPAFLAAGPAAFPTLPPHAEDLPHILDVPDRDVDRERLAATVLDRLREDATDAIDDGDAERIETLLDVTYDLEAWAPTDATALRDRIRDALESTGSSTE